MKAPGCPCCAGEQDPGGSGWKMYARLCDRCYDDWAALRDCTAPHTRPE